MPNGVNWQDLGWTGQAANTGNLAGLLGQFFQTPGEYTKYFEDYDPTGEQAARQSMMGQQAQAQEGARASLWKQFEQARQGRGGGFGGRGRARQTAMGGVFKGLEQQREAGQLGLQEDIRGMREGYRGDVMGMIGSLMAGGAQGVGEGYTDTEYTEEGSDTSESHLAQGFSINAQGVCVQDDNGMYPTQANCESAAGVGDGGGGGM